MGVYQDYMKSEWTRYFTENFKSKHLRERMEIPTSGHKGTRAAAREGNVSLNERHQPEDARKTCYNSLIFDRDPEQPKAPRQVLQLMNEVEKRNQEKYYETDEARQGERVPGMRGYPLVGQAFPVLTLEPYWIHITGHGSRQQLLHKQFYYMVELDEDTGRYVIKHAWFDLP